MDTHQKNVGTFIHLSTFTKWFFPFGNFIAPLLLWSAQRKRSSFIDNHGRNAINFQLSMLLYLIAVAILTIPFVIYQAILLEGSSNSFYFNPDPHVSGDLEQASTLIIVLLVAGTLAVGLFILEIIAVISAAVSASEGKPYKYPLTISFIGAPSQNEDEKENESKGTDSEPIVEEDTDTIIM